MKFRALALTVALSSAFLASAATVNAGTYFPSLLTNGIINTLEDGSREAIFDINGNSTLDAGDVIMGIAQIRLVNATNLAPAYNVYVVYTQQIVSVVPNGTNFDVFFGPTTAAGKTLGDLVPGLSANAGTNGFAAIITTPTGFGDLLGTPPAGTSILNYITALEATPGETTDVVIGFGNAISPVGPTAALPDYLHAITTNASVGLALPGGLTPAALAALQTGQTVANIDGGFSVLQNFDPSVTYSRTVAGSFNPALLYDFALSSATARGAGNDPNYSHFSGSGAVGGVQDNGTLDFAPTIAGVPEPASVILLGIGGLGVLGFARRRRQNA
jgi:hypothetical protein